MVTNSIFRYFKVGDCVINPDVWGIKRHFIIDKMYGNAYCPIIDAHPIGEDKTVGNTCLFDVHMIKLIDANQRPLRKVSNSVLLKLMKKYNELAKREFLIRKNQKKYV